jgi:hypothetical protein
MCATIMRSSKFTGNTIDNCRQRASNDSNDTGKAIVFCNTYDQSVAAGLQPCRPSDIVNATIFLLLIPHALVVGSMPPVSPHLALHSGALLLLFAFS